MLPLEAEHVHGVWQAAADTQEATYMNSYMNLVTNWHGNTMSVGS